jgi:hypothetical protein
MNPAYIEQTGESETSSSELEGAYILEPQEGEYFAIAVGARMAQRFYPQGTLEASDVVLALDSTNFKLSIYDQIVLGRTPNDSRTFTQKQSLVRNQSSFEGLGLVTVSGASVVGAGTAFTQEAPIGSILNIGEEHGVVQSVSSNTYLTISTSLSRNYTNIDYSIADDTLLYWPAASIIDIRTATNKFSYGSDVILSEGKRLVWKNYAAAPTSGTPYSIVYDYYPRYQIVDYGIKGQVVRGYPVLDIVQAKLWKPLKNPTS